MKVPVSALSFLFFLLASSLSAHASWTALKSLGGTVSATSEVSCASWGNGKIACAVRGTDHKLYVSVFKNSLWSGWSALTGTVTSAPSCTERGAGEIVCGVRGVSNDLRATVFNGSSWSSFVSAGGSIFSGPSCSRLNATKVFCAARAGNGGFTGNVYSGAAWGTFRGDASGGLLSGPNCAGDGAGNAICAATGINSHIYVNRTNGTVWEGFLDIQGNTTEAPYCVRLGLAGQVTCLARSGLYWYSARFSAGVWVTGGWSSWLYTNIASLQRPSCAVQTAGQIVCATSYLYDVNSAMWSGVYNGTWGTWTLANGIPYGPPSCATYGGSKVLCALVQLKNNKVVSTIGP